MQAIYQVIIKLTVNIWEGMIAQPINFGFFVSKHTRTTWVSVILFKAVTFTAYRHEKGTVFPRFKNIFGLCGIPLSLLHSIFKNLKLSFWIQIQFLERTEYQNQEWWIQRLIPEEMSPHINKIIFIREIILEENSKSEYSKNILIKAVLWNKLLVKRAIFNWVNKSDLFFF